MGIRFVLEFRNTAPKLLPLKGSLSNERDKRFSCDGLVLVHLGGLHFKEGRDNEAVDVGVIKFDGGRCEELPAV